MSIEIIKQMQEQYISYTEKAKKLDKEIEVLVHRQAVLNLKERLTMSESFQLQYIEEHLPAKQKLSEERWKRVNRVLMRLVAAVKYYLENN